MKEMMQMFALVGAICLWAGAASAATGKSAAFPLDLIEGDRVSAGTEELTFSNLWDGDAEATVTIAQDGAAIFTGLTGEGVKTWTVDRNGRYVLTHTTYTNGIAGKVETAVFVVEGKEVPVGELTVAWEAGSFMYDNNGKTPGVTAKNGDQLLEKGVDYTVHYEGNTNAGTAKAILTGLPPYVGAVTNEFAIAKRSVELTSGSASKPYDGTALVCHSVTTNGDGFVSGEGVDFAFTGSQTIAGSSKNTFDYALKTGTLAGNYTITKTEGDLEVTSGEIVNPFDPDDPSKPVTPEVLAKANCITNYDGDGHSIEVAAILNPLIAANNPKITYSLLRDGTYEVKNPTFTNVVSTSVWYRIEADNFSLFATNALLKILPRSIANVNVAAIGDQTYTGSGIEPIPAVTDMRTLIGMSESTDILTSADYDLSYLNNTNVGTAKIVLSGKNNYEGSQTNTFQIVPAIIPLGPDGAIVTTGYTNAYDGAAHGVSVSATGLKTQPTVQYKGSLSAEWQSDSPTYTDVCDTQVWWKVSAPNYQSVEGTIGLKITQAANVWTTEPAIEGWTYGETAKTPVGAAKFGEVSFSYSPIPVGAVGDYTMTATVAVTANYTGLSKSVGFKISKGALPPGDDPDPTDPSVDPDDPGQREDPTIPFSVFDYVGMYDGVAHTIDTNALKAAYATALGEGVACMYARAQNGVWTAEPLTFKDAGVTSFWYKVASANYADIVKPCKVAITNRPVTVTSGTKLDFVYDGKPHAFTNLTVTAGSFAAGEGIATSNWATVTTVAEGQVPNTFDYVALDGTKLSNYDLTIVTGKIAVVSPDAVIVTITGHVASVVYDGTKKSVSGYDVVSISDPLYTVADFKFVGQSVTNGTNAGTYPMGLKSSDFVNTNANFSSVVFNVTDGQLVISQAANAWTVEPAIEGWTYGETAKTPVGTAKFGEVAFAYSPMPVGAAGDYTMTATVVGTANYTGLSKSVGFKISKATLPGGGDPDPTDPSVDPDDPGQKEDPTIPFSAFDYVGMYDGEAHTIDTNALKQAYATALGEGVACMYARAQNGVWTAEPLTFKDAVVTSFWYKVTSANYADIVKPCKVAITNRPVTVTSGTKLDFAYDGKPHAFTNLTVTAGSFVAGEGIATSNWATVTAVAEGQVDNAFDFSPLEGTLLSNYDLSIVTGKIAVVKGALPGGGEEPGSGSVPAGGVSKFDAVAMYDGEGHTIKTNELVAAFKAAVGGDVTVRYGVADGEGAVVTQWLPIAPDFTNVCETSVWYKVTSANYADIVKPCKVAVTNRPVTVTSGTKLDFAYDGKPHAFTNLMVTAGSFVAGEGIATSNWATVTTVAEGEVSNTFDYVALDGTKLENYDLTVVTGKIAVVSPDAVVVTITGHVASVTYDGTKKSVSGYDVVSISDSLYTAADFKFVGQSVTNGTNAGTYPMGLKSSDFVNTNANFSSVVFNVTDGQLVIAQAANAWTTEPAIEGWAYGETAKTPVGAAKFGTVTFAYSPMPVGAVGDYTMTATVAATANYTGLSKSVDFTIAKGSLPPGDDPDPTDPGVDPDDPGQREDPTIPFSVFDYVGMYDGEAHTIDTNALKVAYATALGEGVACMYARAQDGVWTAEPLTFKDAGVTSFWYKVTSANYADIVKPCKVAITNRPVTVTSGTKLDFAYDGKPHAFTNLMVTAGSFVAGEGIATSNWATVTTVAEGVVPNSFDYAPLDGTKLSNYDLSIVTGKIAVVSPDAVIVTITGHVASVVYDGTKKSVSGYDVVSISDPLYTAADFTFIGQSATNGTNAGTYPMGLKSSDFVNTNANFAFVVFNVTDGQLVISQAANAWTTEPAIEGWTYGETAKTPVGAAKFGTVTFAYSPMPVGAAGDYTMTATVAGTANYTGLSKSEDFTIAKGSLPPSDDPDPTDPSVDPDDPGQKEDPTIPFSAFDYMGMYDGVAHTIDTNELKVAYATALGEGVACMYARAQNGVWTAEPLTFKDAVFTSFWYKVTSANYADIVKPCKVAITNRPVTVTSGTKLDFTYDGKPHAFTNLTVTAGSFVVGEGIATSNWATVTAVVEGQVPNSFDYVALDGTKLSNYDLTVVTGKIAVVKGPLSPDDDPDPTDPSVDPDDPGQREDPTIPFSAFDYVGMYDGAAHTIDTNALKVAYATALGEGVACMYARAQNGVWTAEPLTFKDAVVTSFWYKVTNANYADIVKPCKVAITNRPVTVTSGTKLDFTYDGKPHAFTNLTVTAGNFVAGEGIATSNWATVTTVAEGQIPNAFDYVALDGTKLSNYDLTIVTGKIAVVMPPVSTVKVVLDAIGGKVQGKNVVTQDVVGIYGTLPDASRENYIFDGWFLGVSNDSPQAVSGGAVLAEGNHTLFARWSYDPSVTPDPTTIYKWEAIDANTARITGFLNANQQLQKMVLPDRIGDRFVTEIGASAFANTKCGVKELVLPMFCVVIDSKAFLGIETLETVTFATARLWNDPFTPASVAIGTYAFSGAKALASIMLCKEIASLGNYAFLNTRNLSSITILGKPTVGTQVFRSSGMDAGGVTIHLDPALASDTAYMAALKANMSNVTVKTDAIVTSLTMSTLGMRGTSVRLTVSVEKAAEWGQVDLGAIRVKYRNTLSDPATILTPTAATRNADGTVTLEVAPPEGTSGFFQTIIKR